MTLPLHLKPTLSGTPAGPWMSGRRFDQKSVRACLQRLPLALYPFGYNEVVRPIRFLGDSLRCLRDFPQSARHDAGYQLDKVQRGGQPDDFKPMPSIGNGVEEIRVSDSSGAYRVIYFARRAWTLCTSCTPSTRKTASTGRVDAEDCRTPGTTRLDTGRSGKAMRRNTAADQ